MAKIECPICEENVVSRDAVGLGDMFKRHLMDTHHMTSLARIDMIEGVEPAKELVTYEERRHVTVERPMEGSESRKGRGIRERMRRGREETSEVARDVRGAAGRGGERMEAELEGSSAQGRSMSGRVVDVTAPREEVEEVRTTGPEFMIKCPFCNNILRADDDDKLGRDLKDHWGDDHQLRPTIRAELGMSRAR